MQVHRQARTFALPLILTATFNTPAKGQVLRLMAKDSKGRKFNRITEYVKKQNGKTIYVKAHIRSNRSDCKGE